MVDFRITWALPMHSQPPKSPTPLIRGETPQKTKEKIPSYLLPLSGELQGDFGNFAKVGVIGDVYLFL